jgi:hypothetical protein
MVDADESGCVAHRVLAGLAEKEPQPGLELLAARHCNRR